MIETAHKIYEPNKVIVLKNLEEREDTAESILSYLKPYEELFGNPTAYICRGGVCDQPITDIEVLIDRICS